MNQLIALSGPPTGAPRAAPVARPIVASVSIAIEIRPLTACADIRSEWSDLAARALAPNLFFEPDFALAAAQHLVAFRQAMAILAWRGEPSDPHRRLIGLIPCFPRGGLFVPDDLIGFSNERILDGTPLLDATDGQGVLEAVLSLRKGWMLQGRGLVLRRLDLEGPLVEPLQRAARACGLSVVLPPAEPTRIDTSNAAPTSLPAGMSLREATSRADIRDAVETLLAIEASGSRGRAGTATLQDTREVGFLRAMTRGLARDRQCRVVVLSLAGEVVAAALILGRARRSFLYLAAQSEAHAGLDPLQTLLARLRQAAPNRQTANRLVDTGRFGELRLVPHPAQRPRDLAGRARAAFQRGFRLGRAADAG